ncbi:hypothetical protein [Rhodoferax sp. GW822-FHT02A01]|uniref:hypothetical protein n=1 Tax=Rhodoferax sp. GW822-FHT02A01 TaxID=3141537 RepID=UPI00315D5F03
MLPNKGSIERRIAALENAASPQKVSILICGMQVDKNGYTRISKGDESVARNPGESFEDFQNRAISELSATGAGLCFAWAE